MSDNVQGSSGFLSGRPVSSSIRQLCLCVREVNKYQTVMSVTFRAARFITEEAKKLSILEIDICPSKKLYTSKGMSSFLRFRCSSAIRILYSSATNADLGSNESMSVPVLSLYTDHTSPAITACFPSSSIGNSVPVIASCARDDVVALYRTVSNYSGDI